MLIHLYINNFIELETLIRIHNFMNTQEIRLRIHCFYTFIRNLFILQIYYIYISEVAGQSSKKLLLYYINNNNKIFYD
jgi:hypothetical protein